MLPQSQFDSPMFASAPAPIAIAALTQDRALIGLLRSTIDPTTDLILVSSEGELAPHLNSRRVSACLLDSMFIEGDLGAMAERLRETWSDLVLVVVGIFGTLIASGRIVLFPEPTPSATPLPSLTPIIDVTYSVLVLNATPESGLASQTKDTIIAAGWDPDAVLASEAGSDDFPVTTVYYAFPEDEAAAAGLAEVIGGAEIAQSDVYQPVDNPEAKQLTVVLGLDRIAVPSPSPTE